MDRQRMEREKISPKSGPKSGREEGSLSKTLLTGCPVRRVHIIDTAFYLLVRVHLCQQSHGLDMGRGNSIDVRLPPCSFPEINHFFLNLLEHIFYDF